MNDLDALLAGIVAHPYEPVRWLIVADWLDDHGFAARAELLRLHRMMIDTCCEPDAHPDRAAWQARIVELIDQGVTPCVPQHTLMLPGGVPLVGNFIPPGSFLMGSEVEESERPVHKVTLTKGFFMGICPVTQAQWRAVMGTEPSHFKGDEFPVEQLTWGDAVSFCEKVTARLPTEAEWEYACRAGTTTHFHYGDAPDVTRMNHDAGEAWDDGSELGPFREMTSSVTEFAVNAWGVQDCHGNVTEWCADWLDWRFYIRSPTVDPECQENATGYRVVRGGSCGAGPWSCRSAARDRLHPDDRNYSTGFRIVFTLS